MNSTRQLSDCVIAGCLSLLASGCAPSEPAALDTSPQANPVVESDAALNMPAQGGSTTEPIETSSATPSNVVANVAGTNTVALPTQPDADSQSTLTVGDPAPPMDVSSWLKGDPIPGFQDGQVYVVEFWATWCPPCRDSMPHLSQLQELHGERVQFIGISDEDEPTVREFLDGVQNSATGATWDQIVKYQLALDPERNTHTSYMQASKQTGIPTAFIVGRDAHVEWIGHPLEIDGPLEGVVTGSWDRSAAKEQFVQKMAAEEASSAVQAAFLEAQRSGDYAAAVAEIDQFLARFPGQAEYKFIKFQFLLQGKEFAKVRAFADELADDHWDNSQVLGGIAWALATAVPAADRDLEQALRLATRATVLKEDTDADKLDTLARVYFEMENIAKAVEVQRKAAELDRETDSIRQALQKYEDAVGGAAETAP